MIEFWMGVLSGMMLMAGIATVYFALRIVPWVDERARIEEETDE